MPEKKEFEWSAPEFEYHHKEHSWYWLVVIISGLLILIALVQKNFLFAIFVLIASIVFFKLGHQFPRNLDIRINDQGVAIGENDFHPFDSLSGFATKQLDNFPDGLSQIIFQKKHRLSTHIKILAPTEKIEDIRILLNKHLPEIEYEESLTDHISRLLKF